ncbi:MAG: radical SAM family heme chaperone HemW [Cyanobacteriota bacterium]|nr:radical SAM family heme chaperone HemW [Cyanobacteriota bacterium]MDY6358189.1 radical SAM family heme chaperone HemW [Cyanobacteriota bacterium]MDY6364753.1 radical SAM family heme chaperone HemW [Cyanobacteriota bacterium]
MVKSAYIHIPFCQSKCYYCSFVSYTDMSKKREYLKALENEINSTYNKEVLNTLYIGGGTPSTLSSVEISNILKHFNLKDDSEITVEINPDDANYDYLRELFDIGVNRLSFGAQSFDDEILEKINRRHNGVQIVQAVKNAQNAQFNNISLDFIYGLPSQTIDMFVSDLNKAVGLGVEHISLYGLTIDENCYFASHRPKNLPDDDAQADMYLKAIETLTNSGFEHYEISNFCKKGFESKHNLNYWDNCEYYGFGAAASGYLNGVRYTNQKTLTKYIENPLVKIEEFIETPQKELEEEIFLGLRKMSGINSYKISQKFDINFEEKYSSVLKKYIELNLLKKSGGNYSLTPEGVLVSNTIMSEFLE